MQKLEELIIRQDIVNDSKISNIDEYLKNINAIFDIWQMLATKYPNNQALKDEHHKPAMKLNFKQTRDEILTFGAGLQHLGLQKGEGTSFFAENSARWIISDQAVMMCGAYNAVRGYSTSEDELLYILKQSDSSVLFLENQAVLDKLSPYLMNTSIKFIVLLWGNKSNYVTNDYVSIYTYEEILNMGKKHKFNKIEVGRDDVATLIYTSGTTGRPKGAMITHGNLIHQINGIVGAIKCAKQGDSFLSVLPIWHAYERAIEYYIFSRGICINYSSVKHFKKDLIEYNPQILATVPRIWIAIFEGIQQELQKQSIVKQKAFKFFYNLSLKYKRASRVLKNTDINAVNHSLPKILNSVITAIALKPIHELASNRFYSKIRAIMGNKYKIGISGGGALSTQYEDFFDVVGIKIIVGYGLTETAPILTVTPSDSNVLFTAGKVMSNVQLKVVNPDTFEELPLRQKGLVIAKGENVMKGYYKNKEATEGMISPDGWLNTGDLGWKTENDYLVLCGRHRDLIVLSNGENVEPAPLEEACMQSPYIKQVVVVGQYQKNIGALVFPDMEFIEKSFINGELKTNDIDSKMIVDLIKRELNNAIKERINYKTYEQIYDFRYVPESFTIENGLLTQTLKIKRSAVIDQYSSLIDEMFENMFKL